jgi:hypothetical protein
METKRKEGINKQFYRMLQCILIRFFIKFHQEMHVEKYYGSILSSRMEILFNKQIYSGQNELVGTGYKFYYDQSELSKNITRLSWANWPCLDQEEREPIGLNNS